MIASHSLKLVITSSRLSIEQLAILIFIRITTAVASSLHYLQHISKYNLQRSTQCEGEKLSEDFMSQVFFIVSVLLAMCVMCPQIEYRRTTAEIFTFYLNRGVSSQRCFYIVRSTDASNIIALNLTQNMNFELSVDDGRDKILRRDGQVYVHGMLKVFFRSLASWKLNT